ncbi:hypothetical protein IFM89_024469 [Coptis chinensis]|uniref:Uncharacterized protein n=1 Tax=Coptis chinensis TaxID=261450 RepID=A0A835H8G3_9MAGN|nr:hypothetical protein IFM89_024469 [Coptis chinensis]
MTRRKLKAFIRKLFKILRMNAPRTAGSFAMWAAVFSVCNCSTVNVQQKEDPWNSIIASAATGRIMSMRSELRAASKSALGLGILFGFAEGMNIIRKKFLEERPSALSA